MRLLQFCALIIVFAIGEVATAQISPCLGTPHDAIGNYIGINPPVPDSTQLVAIKVGRDNFNPISIGALVQGNAINVTLTANYLGLAVPPAASCDTVVVGPLAPGNYVLNFFTVDPGLPSQGPVLAGTSVLVVAAAGTGEPIPTTSPIALGIATLLLLIVGWGVFRRLE
jgi:hypothetical protein